MNYVVKAGDSLSKIGAAFSVDWHKIATANGIKPPYVIHAGQTINIPTGETNSSGGSNAGSSNSGSAYDFGSPISLIINGVVLYGIFRVLMKVF